MRKVTIPVVGGTFTEAEQIAFARAIDALTIVMDGHESVPSLTRTRVTSKTPRRVKYARPFRQPVAKQPETTRRFTFTEQDTAM